MSHSSCDKIPDYFRKPELKRQYNEQLFGKIAAKYDLLNKILSFGTDGGWKRIVVSMLPQAKVHKCLDVACGTGDITGLLARKYPQAQIFGLDLTEEMINIAKNKYGCKNVQFAQGDMCDIPFDENSFDVVTACYAIRNAPDLQKSLDEIIRVTKPGGCICLMDISKPASKILLTAELFALKLWCGLWSWLFYRDTRPYGYIAPSLHAFPDSQKLKKILTQSGYTITASRKKALGMIEIILCRKTDTARMTIGPYGDAQ